MNLTGIRPGDIVLIDGPAAKGGEPAHAIHRFHAEVFSTPGGGVLDVWPLAKPGTHRPAPFHVRSRLVVDHWRKAGRRSATRSRKREAIPA